MLGSQPSAFAPVSREHPRLVGAEPDLHVVRRRRARAWRRARGSARRRRARLVPSQIARMTSIASLSASTPWPGVSLRPPIASIASQNAPAPRPSSTRPSLRMSRLATLRASTDGGRSGRLATFGASRTRRRLRGDHRQQRPGVQEARLVGVVLEGHEVQAGDLGELRELDHRVRLLGERRDEDAELQLVEVVRHGREGYCAALAGLRPCAP